MVYLIGRIFVKDGPLNKLLFKGRQLVYVNLYSCVIQLRSVQLVLIRFIVCSLLSGRQRERYWRFWRLLLISSEVIQLRSLLVCKWLILYNFWR